MSTDHPNGGSFLAYPQIIRLLMDRTYRRDMLKTVPADGARADRARPTSTANTRCTRSAIITRAGPARMLGLKNKGHSASGRRCRRDDLHARRESRDDVRAAALRDQGGPDASSRRARSARTAYGKTLHVAPEYDRGVEADIRDWFEDSYSIRWRNYPVDDDLHRGIAR